MTKRVLVRWSEEVERSGVYLMSDSEYAEFEKWRDDVPASMSDDEFYLKDSLRRFLKEGEDGADDWRASVRHETFEEYNGHTLISAKVTEGD